MARSMKILALPAFVAVAALVGCSGGGSSNHSSSTPTKTTPGSTTTTPPPSTSNPPPSGTPVSTGTSLGTPRALHSATLLPSGTILVVGGVDATGNALQTTALVTLTSVTAGPTLHQARVGHTTTILANGKVLVVGGQSSVTATAALNTTEIYDPIAGAFATGPNLTTARSQATATQFGSTGALKVLIAGGSSGTAALNSAEIYDETANTMTAISGMMSDAHMGAGGALMDDGTVVIVGGMGASGAAGADVFSPTTNAFTAASVTIKRIGAAVASTGPLAVMAGGQSSTGIESTTETYASATKTFTSSPSLATARRDATATLVPISGTVAVVFVGGRNASGPVAGIEALSGTSLSSGSMAAAGTLATARYAHTATALSTGQLVVIGGYDSTGAALASIEQITPTISTSSSSSSGGLGGLGGLLGSLLGGSGSGGIGSILSSLLGGLLGGSSGSSGGIGSILSSLLGGSSSSGSSSGGFGSILSSLLGGLLGGGSSSSGSSSSGIGGILSSLLGGLLGGGSGSSSSGGLGGILGSLLGGLFGGGSGSSSAGPVANPHYTADVAPILANNCTRCHNSGRPGPGTGQSADLQSYINVLYETVPGNPSSSPIIQKINGGTMSGYINTNDAQTITNWVQQGCPQ